MRILLITDNHSASGGAELYFFALKKRLQALPQVIVHSLGFAKEAVQTADERVFIGCTSQAAKIFWRFIIHPFLYWRLRQYIKTFKPDVIHLHNIKQYTATLFLALRGYPIVQTVHDYALLCPVAYNIHKDLRPCTQGFSRHCFWQHQIKHNKLIYLLRVLALKRLQQLAHRHVKKFIAPSPQLTADLQRSGFKNSVFIPPFVTTNTATATILVNHQQFLFAGNLSAHKGIYHLLTEFALACQRNPRLQLLIAGTGREEQQVKKQIQRLQIQAHVKLLGWQADLTPYYQTSCALIFPSLCLESFGLVITEAMSHGRAVIASRRGPATWLVANQQTGLLFEPTLRGDLAEKILLLAANPTLSAAYGQQAAMKMQTFINNERSLQQIVAIYQDQHE